jgi:predicted amidophosphoribosyltransferase
MSAIKRIFSSIASPFINIMVPRNCLMCQRSLVNGEEYLCLDCYHNIPRTNLHLSDFNTIHKRVGGDYFISHACGWFHYYTNGPYSRLIRLAKYGDMPDLARYMGRSYATELSETAILDDVDVLLPVPMHWRKRLQRGYNQTKEIALGISDITGIPVGDNLRSTRYHIAQARQTGAERYQNVTDTYIVLNANELDGLSITFIDDVVTTGATLYDCIRAVCNSVSPRKINILTIGVTHLR